MLRKVCLLVAGCLLLASARPAAAHCNYLIKTGDSLFSIGEENGTNETALLELNPSITDKDNIIAGQTLRLPCQGGADESGRNIYELIEHRSDLSTLFAALASVGLLEGDLQDGSFDATLFAPTDAAFSALLDQLNLTAAELLADSALVGDVLAYHIIPGDKLEARDLRNNRSYRTLLQGKRLRIRKADGKVDVRTVAGQSVRVTKADLDAGDAVVHLIDEVLLPLEAEEPAEQPTTPAAGDACTYTVKAGDTLFDIATANGLTLDALLALNPEVETPDLIQPGDTLTLKQC